MLSAVETIPVAVTRAEAARLLRKTTRTIDRWLRAGVLRASKVAGTSILIPGSEIQRVLEGRAA